jgi:MFS family permease
MIGRMSLRHNLGSLPAAAWILFAGTLVNRLGTFVLVFLVLYLRNQGFSAPTAGLALSAYGVGGMAASLAGGFLADHLGRRKTIVLSMFGGAATMVALSLASSLPLIIGLTGLAGLVGESYRPPSSALLTDITKPGERLTAFAVYRLAINLGMGIGPALGGLLAERSFKLLFWGDALTSSLFGIIALAALPDKRFLLFLVASTLGAMIYMQSHSTFPLQVTSLGFSNATYGLLLSLNGLLVLAIELPMTTIIGRYPARTMMTAGVVTIGLGFALTALVSALPLVALTVIVWTLGEIMYMPVASAYVADIAPKEMRGRYSGAFGMSFGVAFVVGPAAGTLAFSWSPVGLWASCAGLGLLAGAMVWAAAMRPTV